MYYSTTLCASTCTCRVVVSVRPLARSGVGKGCAHAVQQTLDAVMCASVELHENSVRTRSGELMMHHASAIKYKLGTAKV